MASGSLALAGDYRRYYAATKFLLQGHSPYDQAALLAAEQHLRSLPAAVNTTADGFVLLPFILWPLIPLSPLPFWISFAVFVAASLAVIGLSLSHVARSLGWQKWWLVPVFACLWWPLVWGRVVGQLDFLALVGILAACWLTASHRHLAAGVALLGIWVQPELGWMAVAALAVVLLHDRKALLRTAASFLAASTLIFAISALVPQGVLFGWFTSGTIFVQHEASHEFQLLGVSAILQAAIPRAYGAYRVTSAFTLGTALLV
ncbi:MAG: glycosyltransferase family 87 protein [Candidatus Dormibacteria bacterium]